MPHPYFSKTSVFEDVPKADEERDNDLIDRLGEESDDEIDDIIQTQIDVPLVTNIDVLNIASTLRTEGKFYHKIGERTRGLELIEMSDKKIQEWMGSKKQVRPSLNAFVDITDGTFNDYSNSPIITD